MAKAKVRHDEPHRDRDEGVRVASGGQPHGPDPDGVSANTLPAGGGQREDEDECRKNWMKRE